WEDATAAPPPRRGRPAGRRGGGQRDEPAGRLPVSFDPAADGEAESADADGGDRLLHLCLPFEFHLDSPRGSGPRSGVDVARRCIVPAGAPDRRSGRRRLLVAVAGSGASW